MKILKKLDTQRIKAFYNGPIYPLIIAFLVVLGSITSLEVFFNILNCFFIITALVLCDTLRPVIINLCTFVFQISVKYSPFYPNYSNYYFTSWRLPVLIILAVLIFLAIVFFIVKNKLYKGLSLKKTPLLLPLSIFSAVLLLNGAFSSGWVYKNLIYAGTQTICFLFVFIFLYQGLKKEKADEIGSYFAYISMLMAFIIAAELFHLYLTSDSIFIDGSINKVGVALGWGIWNLVGSSALVLIPMNFYGMQKNKYPWLYFIGATLAWLTAIFSMSRNALIFSSLIYLASVLIFCFVGKKKKTFKILAVLGALAFVAGFAVFFDKIYSVFKDFFDRGLSDNGRFALWRKTFTSFLEVPVFGKGFYGLGEVTDTFGPWPDSAHNTILQLLSAGGIVSLLAYGFYRFKTIIPFLKRPCILKTMLGLSIIGLLFGSLLDNFIFDVYPTFYMNAALVIAFKKNEEMN